MFKKIISIILILLLIPFTLTGCYDASAIESLAYVVAIGLDAGENNSLKLTLQFATTTSSNSGGGSSQSQDSVVTTIDCSSIDSGISMINSYISKKVNLTHCKIIVFSEELAEQGIRKYINTMGNNVEIRPDCNIIISRCNASDFISNSKPTLTDLTARYYEVLLNSQEYTGYTLDAPIWEFSNALESKTMQAVAILGGLNLETTHKQTTDDSSIYPDYSYKAGETPIDNPTKVQNLGIAVFKDDKLVGEMNGIECVCYSILTNQLKETTLSIPNPFEQDEIMDLSVTLSKKSKNSVELVNSTPYITCDISVEAMIQSLGDNSDYSNKENLKIIEQYLANYLEAHMLDYLYKTSRDFNSDITGFGKSAVHKYLTLDEWNEANWLENYSNAVFSVNINSNVKGSYLFMKH